MSSAVHTAMVDLLHKKCTCCWWQNLIMYGSLGRTQLLGHEIT